MNDSLPDMLDFEDSDILQFSENILNLVDPPQLDDYPLLNYKDEDSKLIENSENTEDIIEDLLNLPEPPKIDNGERIEISKFAEDFVKPIVKEANPMHDPSGDNKTDISSSDDGFEYVKKEEVIFEERNEETDVGEAMKRELEDIVSQEEMKLKSTNYGIKPESKDHFDNDNFYVLESDSMQNSFVLYRGENNFNNGSFNESVIEDENSITAYFKESEHNFDESIMHISFEGNNEEIKIDENINKYKDIINWTYPISSALLFSILMFLQFGILMEYSVISILAYFGILLIIVSLVYKVSQTFRLINDNILREVISFKKEDVEYYTNVTLSYAVSLHKEIKSIAYVESYAKNVKVFAVLWVLTYIGQIFNLQSLMFIGTLLLFSIPVVHLKYKKEINTLLDVIWGHINSSMNKVKSTNERITLGRLRNS